MPPEALSAAIAKIAGGADLTEAETAAAFEVVMAGEASAGQIGALLMGLRVKGETASEVAGAARALRNAMVVVEHPAPDSLVDTCGTGGGSFVTFNISTAAGLVAAGAGVPVAKHGNRSFTSRSGSADVLEVLGVSLEADHASITAALRDAGIVFMFAPAMHPAMRHVGPVRRELAVPTIMNVLGPLANPARVRRQVIGVAERRRQPLIAGALAALGTLHALVVHGEPGLDEISPIGPTHVVEVRGDKLSSWELVPDRFERTAVDPGDLAGGTPQENAAVITSVLSGGGPPGARLAVLLNAAAAIYVSDATTSIDAAYERAKAVVDQGLGLAALERLRAAQGSTKR